MTCGATWESTRKGEKKRPDLRFGLPRGGARNSEDYALGYRHGYADGGQLSAESQEAIDRLVPKPRSTGERASMKPMCPCDSLTTYAQPHPDCDIHRVRGSTPSVDR